MWLNRNPESSYSFSTIKVYSAGFYPPNGRVDVVSVRRNLPLGITAGSQDEAKLTARRVFPTIQYQAGTLSVSKTPGVSVDLAFRPTNCSYNLNLFTLMNSFNSSNGPAIRQSTAASPPVTGSFDLAWNGTTLSNIQANVEENDLSALFKSIPEFGNVEVTRSKDCSGYKWTIKWLSGGDKPAVSIASTNLSGSSVLIAASTIRDGGASFSPIQADFLRTYHSKPQVNIIFFRFNSNRD